MPDLTFVGKLQDAIATCQRLTEPPLLRHNLMLEEYANGFYGRSLKGIKKPLNMVFRGISVLVPLLAAQNPKAMVRARVAPFIPHADTLRLTQNHCIQEINMVETLRKIILNSLTYMGIGKTGVSEGGPQVEDAYGYLHDAGQFYFDCVDGADYVWDVAAKIREEMDFEGNRYRIPMDYINEENGFSNYERLEAKYSEYGTEKKRAENIAKETIHNFKINELKPYAEVYDIWLPSENVILTIPPEGQGNLPLKEVEYGGPEGGPYDILTYHTFPESIIPIPPIFAWLDLHLYINTIARKMGRQANREKTVIAYDGTAEEDMKAVVEAEDGQTVRVDNVDRLKEIKFGGINDQAYQYISWLKQMWSEQAGNADLLGGLRQQANTLGQEQMLQANATIGVEDMINQVHSFTKSILSKMAYYIWTDPTMNLTVSKRVAGVGSIDVKFSPETREGDFLDYNIDVEPYSMQRMNPQLRAQKIMEVVNGIIMPTIQLGMQQGSVPDIAALIKSVTRDTDLTEAEVDEWYRAVVPANTNTGPYQPMQGQTSGQADDRFGATPASRQANMTQQQTRAGGKSSPPQK